LIEAPLAIELDEQEQPGLRVLSGMEAMLDFAVRNSRVLARHALRHSRGRLAAPDGLPAAVRELAQAVWTLAWGGAEARGRALAALAGRARPSSREPDLVVTEAVRQVRATAVGLMCAAELVEDSLEPSVGMPTAQLLARPLLPATGGEPFGPDGSGALSWGRRFRRGPSVARTVQAERWRIRGVGAATPGWCGSRPTLWRLDGRRGRQACRHAGGERQRARQARP
jgi:hypothetical protein